MINSRTIDYCKYSVYKIWTDSRKAALDRIERNYTVDFRSAATDLKDFAELNEILIKNLAAVTAEGSGEAVTIAA